MVCQLEKQNLFLLSKTDKWLIFMTGLAFL